MERHVSQEYGQWKGMELENGFENGFHDGMNFGRIWKLGSRWYGTCSMEWKDLLNDGH